jgi:hypothetical protein
MSLIQYIKKSTKKGFLTLQDLNIIKQKVDEIWNYTNPETWKGIDFDKASEAWANYQKIMDDMPYDIERVGVMYASVLPNRWANEIIIGYSLCHTPIDQFDHIGDGPDLFTRDYRQKKGLGRKIAFSRAVKWTEKTKAGRLSPEYYALLIPPSIRPNLKQFIQRAVKYYQDKELTEWAVEFMGNDL